MCATDGREVCSWQGNTLNCVLSSWCHETGNWKATFFCCWQRCHYMDHKTFYQRCFLVISQKKLGASLLILSHAILACVCDPDHFFFKRITLVISGVFECWHICTFSELKGCTQNLFEAIKFFIEYFLFSGYLLCLEQEVSRTSSILNSLVR